ncbi:hypothetical protein [Bremerella alba]|uniref:Uncharacterized protein n=1 Tax=Bremerella alba TaxID=980252 RepID=A0A7V8V820_9BACT|nr:hypothetical protein [Bremerella alba]MBA2116682.1 hypothetical protein [Bremerella alba]
MTHNSGIRPSSAISSDDGNNETDVSDFPQDVAAAWANVILDLFDRGVRNSNGEATKRSSTQNRRNAG